MKKLIWMLMLACTVCLVAEDDDDDNDAYQYWLRKNKEGVEAQQNRFRRNRDCEYLTNIKQFVVYNFADTARRQEEAREELVEQFKAIGHVVPVTEENLTEAIHHSYIIFLWEGVDRKLQAVTFDVTVPLAEMMRILNNRQNDDYDVPAPWVDTIVYERRSERFDVLKRLIQEFCEDYKTANPIPEGDLPTFYLMPLSNIK
jgi:glycerol-3-phosphate cytidylyltransferase-like family protein